MFPGAAYRRKMKQRRIREHAPLESSFLPSLETSVLDSLSLQPRVTWLSLLNQQSEPLA